MITLSLVESKLPKAKAGGFGDESDLGTAMVEDIIDGADGVVVVVAVAVPKLN